MSTELLERNIVYYNASIYNNTIYPIPVGIVDTRGTSIIDSPQEWEMSIIRFDATNLHLIPIGCLYMQPGAIEGVLSPTFLSFTMTYLGVDYIQYVLFGRYISLFDMGSIKSYQEILDRMNICIVAIFASLPIGPSVTTPPMLVYNTETQLISFYFEENWSLVSDVLLYGNISTHDLLFSMPIIIGGFNQINGKDVQFNFKNGYIKSAPSLVAGKRDNFPYITNSIPNNMLYMPQEALSISSWGNIRSLFLTSSSLPIYSDLIPFSANVSDLSFSNNSINMISDFVFNIETNPMSDRIKVEYLPTAEYRLLSLRGKEPIKRIQIDVFYTLPNGRNIQLLIEPGASFNVKIMFRRKNIL